MIKGYYPLARFKRSAQRAFINAGLLRTHQIDFEQPNGKVHAYTDGSYSKKQQRLGYAAVIKMNNPDDELVLFDSNKRLTKPDGSRINQDVQNIAAELMGAILALETIPENSNVILHTDFMEIQAFLNNKIDNDEHQKYRRFDSLWRKLEKAADRHNNVSSKRATDNEKTKSFSDRRIMRIAHNFSVQGSGSSNMKPFLTEEDDKKYSDYIDGFTYETVKPTHPMAGSTPNSMDIIDPSSDGDAIIEYGWEDENTPQP